MTDETVAGDGAPGLADKLAALPARPGVYVFRDAAGLVLYIGKAKSLRSRVRSYFQAGNSDDRAYLPALISQIVDLTTIITKTEKEAAILENSLIKEHQPRFNVKLRDDKEYLNLRLDPKSRWPRLDLVRRPKHDGAMYFGPYHSATAARRTLHVVEKHFKLRTCSDRELSSRKRPCLKYQIKRCPAPCVLSVDAGEYQQQVHAVGLFLAGRHDRLSHELRARMAEASENLRYEAAATYRDQIAAVEKLRQQQRVVTVDELDQDVVGMYREGELVEVAILTVREGRVVEAVSRSHTGASVDDEEVIAAYLRDSYGVEEGGRAIPDRILLPVLPEGAAGVEEWLSERRATAASERGLKPPRRVRLHAPERGNQRQLLDVALENARHAFEEKRRTKENIDERLAKLQARLRLPTLPRRIECTDISHLGGQDTVGSVVALLDGAVDKKRYRTYTVKAPVEGDDYAAMYEVLSRRFRRGKEDQEGEWDLPDLFVVDGGRGQLAVAVAAAHDLGLFDLRLAGLAKERENVAGDKLVDRVYLPDQKNPIPLRSNSPELFLLAMARDEAHRFANRGRKKLGKARRMQSVLDTIPGIGPKTKETLLKHFGSVDNIQSASAEELLALPGIDRRHVRALLAHWTEEPPTAPSGNEPPVSAPAPEESPLTATDPGPAD